MRKTVLLTMAAASIMACYAQKSHTPYWLPRIVVLFFNIGWIWLKLCGPSVAYVFVGGVAVSI